MNKKLSVFLFLVVLFIFVALGFAGYYFGFLGFIYNVMINESFGKFPLVVLSTIFGMAAFFSPCSFTVLPGYVSHYLTKEEEKGNVVKGFYFGFIAALGVIAVNVIVGIVIAILGAAAPFAKDPRQDIPALLAVRTLAGLLIAYLGLMTVLGKHIEVPYLQKRLGEVSFGKSIFLYGMIYNGAAIGCTGPLILGLILYALTLGSLTNAFLAFLVFALTMGVLMITLTTSIAIFKVKVVQRIAPFTPVVQKTAGYVMLFAGLTTALLTLEGNRIFVEIFFPFLK